MKLQVFDKKERVYYRKDFKDNGEKALLPNGCRTSKALIDAMEFYKQMGLEFDYVCRSCRLPKTETIIELK